MALLLKILLEKMYQNSRRRIWGLFEKAFFDRLPSVNQKPDRTISTGKRA